MRCAPWGAESTAAGRIPSRSDVDVDPPRLIKGFKKVFQDIENDNVSESIRLFQQTFGPQRGLGDPKRQRTRKIDRKERIEHKVLGGRV